MLDDAAGRGAVLRTGGSARLLAASRAHPPLATAVRRAVASSPALPPPRGADVAAAVASCGDAGSPHEARAVAAELLAAWATSDDGASRGAVASCDGAMHALGDATAFDERLRGSATAALACLARDGAPLPPPVCEQLASVAEACCEGRDVACAADAVGALSSCASRGQRDAAHALAPLLPPLSALIGGDGSEGAAADNSAACFAVCGALRALASGATPLSHTQLAHPTRLLVAWATAEGDGGDGGEAARLRVEAQRVLGALCACPPHAQPAVPPLRLPRAWLAAMLRRLAVSHAGWAPRAVEDDAAADAGAAAKALDAHTAAAQPHDHAQRAHPPLRRLYGLLPPAAVAAVVPAPPSGAPPSVPAPPPDPLASSLKALSRCFSEQPGACEYAVAAGLVDLLSLLVACEPDLAPTGDAPGLAARRSAARAAADAAMHPAAGVQLASSPLLAWLAAQAGAAPVGGDGPLPGQLRKLGSHARRALLNARAHGGSQPRPLYGDGVYLLSDPPERPTIDVVFIHGLRGGPFATWRARDEADGAAGSSPGERGAAAKARPICVWPADWLPADAVGARLLSLSYRSRYSEWEGSSRGVDAHAQRLRDLLALARVGDRPLVVVAHSMGGVLLKRMLATCDPAEGGSGGSGGSDARDDHTPGGEVTAQSPRPLGSALRGCVFFACPHFGSSLATIGSFRLLRPAGAVAGLQPGAAALADDNAALRRAARRKEHPAAVISFVEGAPTQLAQVQGRALSAEVVRLESAWPGFGDIVVLPAADHIDVCKPRSRGEPGYAKTAALIADVLRQARAEDTTREAAQAAQL